MAAKAPGRKLYVLVLTRVFVAVLIAEMLVPFETYKYGFVLEGVNVTVKLVADVPVPPAVVTVTVPFVAPIGTVTVIDVAVAADTVACVPLNLMVLFAGVVLKLLPVMVTVVPTAPLVGVNEVMVGAVAEPVVNVHV